MRTCKLKPEYSTCARCLDLQIQNSVVALCDECEIANQEYQVLLLAADAFGGYALIVNKYGTIKRVSTERIYDLKGEDD